VHVRRKVLGAEDRHLVIDGGSASLAPAGELWGLSAAEAERRLRDRMGAAWRVAAIGSAGERCVRYATVSHDGRHAGRGGLGAVMGSKLCKAVMVRPSRKVHSWDSAGVLAAARDLRGRSFGPATAKYRELGTMANLLAFNAISTLPTLNFSAASFAGAPSLGAEEVAELRQVARSSCASCSIGCEHLYRGPGGKNTRMEYENVFALGPLCGVSDADAFVSVTQGDNRNVMAAQIALQLGSGHVVARVYEPVRSRVFGAMGVYNVSPTILGAQRLFDMVVEGEES